MAKAKAKAKPKPKPKTLDVAAKAKQLKKIGAINYDLRRELTNRQKQTIRNRYKEFENVLKKPGDYVKLKAGKGQVRKAQKATYVAHDDYIFVRKKLNGVPLFDKVELIDNRIVETMKIPSAEGAIKRKTVTDLAKHATPETIEKLIESGGQLPPGHYIMARVGAESPFAIKTSAAQLLEYMQTSPGWKDVMARQAAGQIGHVSITIYKPAKGDNLLARYRKKKRAAKGKSK